MECETLFGLSETQLMCPLWGKKTLRLGSLTARKQMPSDGRNPFPNPISPTLMRKQAQMSHSGQLPTAGWYPQPPGSVVRTKHPLPKLTLQVQCGDRIPHLQ